MRKFVSTVSAAAALVLAAASLNAQTQTFEANWINAGTGATAVATFDLDLAIFNAFWNPGLQLEDVPLNFVGMSNLTLTITGASSGNGTWTTDDFEGVYLYTNMAIDPMVEWVGQPQFDGFWGQYDGSFSHDFNFFGATAGAPDGVNFYLLGTDEGEGELLSLVSVHPVPVPSAAALLGLGGLAAARRRRR